MGGGNSFLIVAVNIFVLISGYFGIKLTKNKPISLIIQVIAYTFVLSTIPYFICGNLKSAIASGLFISHTRYWFFKYYLLLMFFAPLINDFFEKSNKKVLLYFCVLLLIVSAYFGFIWQDTVNKNGYTFFQFLMLYCFGMYIRKYDVKIKTQYALPIYIICSLITGALFYYFYKTQNDSWCWRMTFYNSPFVILASICLFMVFLNLNIKSKAINKLSKSTFAIYLIQCSFAGDFYYKTIGNYYTNTGNNLVVLFLLIAFAIGFCAVAFLIDPAQRKLNQWLTQKVANFKLPR